MDLRDKLEAALPKKGMCCEKNCALPKEKGPGKRYCYWHWLKRQPMDLQKRVANDRLSNSTDTRRTRLAVEWPEGFRWCSGCLSMVPMFYCSGSRCRPCASSAAQRNTFNITQEQQAALLIMQDNRCAICGRNQQRQSLATEHSHTTQDVRGLACDSCNLTIGAHFDNPLWFVSYACYLTDPPFQKILGKEMTNAELDKQILELVHEYRFKLGYTK